MKRIAVALLFLSFAGASFADDLVCKDYINEYGTHSSDCHWVYDMEDMPTNIPADNRPKTGIESIKQYNDREVRIDYNNGRSSYCSKNILGEWSCN